LINECSTFRISQVQQLMITCMCIVPPTYNNNDNNINNDDVCTRPYNIKIKGRRVIDKEATIEGLKEGEREGFI